jgi:D-galactarolactone cycloisomerase
LAVLPETPSCRNALPFGQVPALEFDQTPHPIREELAVEPILPEGGWVKVPTAPGLGVEVREEILSKYRVVLD